MSLLGFDAIGRLAIGQVRQNGQQTFTLAADPGALALAPQAVSFAVFEAAPYTVLSLSPINLAQEIFDTAETGSMSFEPVAITFTVLEAVPFGALAASGSISFEIFEVAPGGALSLTPVDVVLRRTGYDYEAARGGVGHYLLEAERAKQLAAITRTAPSPINRSTAPQFQPFAASYSAPPAPGYNVAAIQNERMGAQMAAARAAKQRREIEAILLLAS